MLRTWIHYYQDHENEWMQNWIFVTRPLCAEEEIGRFSSDPEKYNAAARTVMQSWRCAVNDI